MEYIDYRELHRDTINKLHQMVNSGKITVETACSICADFVPESIKEDIITYLSTVEDKELIPYETWIAWLEKQGEQNHAWSEEDEQTFIKSVEALEDSYNFMLADWLKEHKNQFLKPQNRWKPSDEQMQALSNAGNSFRPFEEGHKILWSLYNDLKKLREE